MWIFLDFRAFRSGRDEGVLTGMLQFSIFVSKIDF